LRRTLAKESHIDGHHKGAPLAFRHPKIGQKPAAARYALIFCLITKQDRAGVARANKFAAERVKEVLVIQRQFPATHFACLGGRRFAHKLA
jgi:hypothetical protein